MKPIYIVLILAVAFTTGGVVLLVSENAAAGWVLLAVGILLALVTAGQAVKESK